MSIISPQDENSRRTGYLIVGAGLAGCTLGFLLRKAGADVMALERYDAVKKDKLCAGAMGEETFKLLANIFGEESKEMLKHICIPEIRLRYKGLE